MEFTYDYYQKLNKPVFYLCNPDETLISAIHIRNDSFALRFNDLSELSFEVPSHYLDSSGETKKYKYYDLIQTKRLIDVDNIGIFVISNVAETDTGTANAFKTVSCTSYQSKFSDMGFYLEERVYCFYNPLDPRDDLYDSSNIQAIPSVVGQLYKQLGIKCNLGAPSGVQSEWTITYITEKLRYVHNGNNNICRSFTESEDLTGYDFMVSEVENAFEIIFDFDFLNKTIEIKTIDEILQQRSDIYLSFDNLVNDISVEENADDLVTVLDCVGGDLDITMVNPTGTNYICDFSYYMDEVNHNWMSQALINKLKQWKIDVDSKKDEYAQLVKSLQPKYKHRTELLTEKQFYELTLSDLIAAFGKYNTDEEHTGKPTFVAEKVDVGQKSFDASSEFNSSEFVANGDTYICFSVSPMWDEEESCYKIRETAEKTEGTLEDGFRAGHYYFIDGNNNSYCKLTGKAKPEYRVAIAGEQGALQVVANDAIPSVNTIRIGDTGLIDDETGEYSVSIGSYVVIDTYVGGYQRYVPYEDIQAWIDLYTTKEVGIQNEIDSVDSEINAVNESLNNIANSLNIIGYFSSTPKLLKELKCYWVEGTYSNDNIAVSDDTTMDERIELANELMAGGENDLIRVSQPKFSMSSNVVNFLEIYKYKNYARSLKLGTVLTIKKSDALHYYPALTEFSFSFSTKTNFNMTFANGFKPGDSLYTFADLVNNASSTSKTVNANWKEITRFSRENNTIKDLLQNPLDMTLRTANSNMYNQEFLVNDKGILGRKHRSTGETDLYEDEQIAIINNIIMFTDDGWKTLKMALGKVSFNEFEEDGTATLKEGYGILADAIIGSLLQTNALKVVNDDGCIFIDDSGIRIKHWEGEGENRILKTVFNAELNGDLSLTGEVNVTSGRINIGEYFSVDETGHMIAKSATIGDCVVALDAATNTYKLSVPAANITGKITADKIDARELNVNNNLLISSEGLLTAKGANIEGNIDAKSGTIGGFTLAEITDGNGNTYSGLTSDTLSIMPTSVHLKTQSSLNLSNNVILFTEGDISYIATQGNMDFEIRNLGGAGIRFKANTEDETITQNIVFGAFSYREVIETTEVDADASYSRRLCYITIPWKVGESGVLRAPQHYTLYCRYCDDWPGSIFGIGASVDYYTVAIELDIPAYTHQGTFEILMLNGRVASDITCYGISKTYSENNSDFNFNAISFECLNINATNNILYSLGSFCPNEDGKYFLGHEGKAWDAIRANTSVITDSDKRKKDEIKQLSDVYNDFFDKLAPASFVFINGSNGRRHLGFIAQEVENALFDSGLTTKDFAGLCIGDDENRTYGLRYEEFIALNTWEIQKLKAKVKELENKLQ